MRSFVSLAYALLSFQCLSTYAAVPVYFQHVPISRRDLSGEQVRQELGRSVSNTTSIFGKDDPRYPNSTARWNVFASPDFEVVIEPGQESDVSTIVSAPGLSFLPDTSICVEDWIEKGRIKERKRQGVGSDRGCSTGCCSLY